MFAAEWQVMCIYKALHKDRQMHPQGLGLTDFHHFYEVINYKWEEVRPGQWDELWLSVRCGWVGRIPWPTHKT